MSDINNAHRLWQATVRLGRASVAGRPTYGEIEDDRFHPVATDPFLGNAARSGPSLGLDEVQLLSPVAPRVVLLMVNAFLPDGVPLPPGEVPWITPKMTSLIRGPRADVTVPSFATGDLVVEAELAVVIGRDIHQATAAQAAEAIFGYTVFNDMTTGEIRLDMDMFRAKSIEGFASMGPWITTEVAESDIAAGLEITATVGDEVRVRGNTRHYKFPVHEVVRFASMHTRLRPGDVISLGTPAACYVTRGESAVLAVERVGELHNRLVG